MSLKTFQANLAHLRPWLTILAILWLLMLGGLGWLVKSLLILVGFILLAPVVAFLGFRWWLQRNLVQANCPVCQLEFTGLNQTQLRCPSCGERLLVKNGQFERLTPPGTIDVAAIEVGTDRGER